MRARCTRSAYDPGMRATRWIALLLVAALGLGVTACGSDEPKSKPAPTTVSSNDLDKAGEFWLSLTPDLKDELVDIGKQRLGEERPDGATGIQALDTDKLVAEIDKQYANQSKRSQAIYAVYALANNTLAKANLDDALDGLNQLCNSEPKPAECGN